MKEANISRVQHRLVQRVHSGIAGKRCIADISLGATHPCMPFALITASAAGEARNLISALLASELAE
jgi:hypothetical protein